MGADTDLGTLSTGVDINLTNLRSARGQMVTELASMSASLQTWASEAEKAGKRAEEAVERAANGRGLREAAKQAKDAAKAQADAAKQQADAVASAAKQEAASHAARTKMLGDVSRGAMVAGGAITAALGMAAHAAAEFDQAMRNTNSLAKLNENQFGKLKSSVLSLVDDPNIRQGPTDLAKGLYDVYGSGFAGQKAMDVLKVSAYGASAGMTDTATSARALMAVLNSGVQGADDAKTAMDVLFREVDLGVNTFEQLAGAIGLVLPSAKLMGVSIQEVAAALATMTRQGLSVDEATTALNNMLLHIAKPSKDAAKEMKSLGIEYGTTALQTKGLVGWLDEAIKKTDGNADKLIKLIPELRGMKGELILANEHGKTYKEMLQGMAHASDGAGAAAKALAEQNKGAAAQVELARKNFEKLSIELGTSLLPAINRVLGKSVELMREFHKLPTETQGAIAKFALGAAGFLTVAGLVGTLIIKLAELKTALKTLALPAWLTGGKVLTAGGLGAGAGYSGVGGLLPGLVGGAMFATPLVGGALGGMAITHQNDVVNQNAINDAALPPYIETAGKRAEVQERIDKRKSKVNEIRSKPHADELDRLLPLLGGADQKAARVKEDQGVLDAYNADVAERDRLNKVYNTQKTQFDKAEKANGVKRPAAPPKKAPTKKTGGGGGGHELTDDEKRAAKQLAESREKALETFAQGQIDSATAAFEALLEQYRENGGIKNLARARELSRVIEARQKRLAGLRLAHAEPTDKPNAKAEFDAATSSTLDLKTGALVGSIPRDEKSRQKSLDDAQTERLKKQKEDDDKSAKELQEQKDRSAKEAEDIAEENKKHDEDVRQALLKITMGMVKTVEDDLELERITRTEAKARLEAIFAKMNSVDENYVEVAGKIRGLNKSLGQHGENEFDLSGPGMPDAEGVPDGATQKNLPGGAVLTQAPDLEKPKDTNPFKFIGDSMAQNLDFSMQHWKSFHEGFQSVLGSLKQAFIQAVTQMIAKWATMKIGSSLGALGGPVGSLVGAGAGSILGGLFGGHRAKGGPMDAGKIYEVAEPGTGGEFVIPKVDSLAVPMKALMNGGGGGGGRVSSFKGGSVTTNQIDVHVSTGDINHPMDVQGLGDTLGWAVNAALPTTRWED